MLWKVSKQKIQLFPHWNADKLVVGRVGDYQVVVPKGMYQDNDVVVFAPEKSILTGAIRDDFDKYLAGPNRNRVHAVRLRGELSCGVIIPPALLPDLSAYEIDQDISSVLGITKYIPIVPEEMLGAAEPTAVSSYMRHDAVHFSTFESDFQEGERIVVTEKIHGTQCSCVLQVDGKRAVMSKGLAEEGIAFKEGEDNVYWQAVNNSMVFDLLETMIAIRRNTSHEPFLGIQVIGEVFPCQYIKRFKYGLTGDRPRFRAFKTLWIYEGRTERIAYDSPENLFREHWVPILYDGPCPRIAIGEDNTLRKLMLRLHQGQEQVSGQELHIREGCVIEPYVPRPSSRGYDLILKVINPEYKETGEELS